MIGLPPRGCYASKPWTICPSHKVDMISKLNIKDKNAVKSLNQNNINILLIIFVTWLKN